MRKIKEVVVVEGKTDTVTLQKLFNVDTIETDGLQLSKQTLEMIEEVNKKRGIIVLTDPDFPGRKIRDRIQERVPNCKHAFVEKKDAIGKKKLGVAEAKEEAIIKALENCVTFSSARDSLSWSDFLSLDIIGNKKRRLQVYESFHLGYGNVKTLYKRLNMVGITKQQIVSIVGE